MTKSAEDKFVNGYNANRVYAAMALAGYHPISATQCSELIGTTRNFAALRIKDGEFTRGQLFAFKKACRMTDKEFIMTFFNEETENTEVEEKQTDK